MNIEQYSPQSGRFLKEDGTYINIADALGGTETGQIADIEKHAAHSGRFIKEDGTVINIAESIGSGGGGGSGSSDDSAPPIVETYNGQTIQCSMSADRPIKGLNLYATCEQKTTSGAQLINDSEIEIGGLLENGEPYSTNKRIRTGSIPVTEGERYFLSVYSPYAIAISHIFNGEGGRIAAFSNDNAIPSGGVSVRFTFHKNESELTNEDVNALKSTLMFNKGESALPYEPYTGGVPSPNGDYPQEIQAISDFVVEVKNSMGEVATPQTLNVTIPEQGFYGIPVSEGGNYTDESGQQWICDEFDYKRGKYIQRVRKVILNGNENERWSLYKGGSVSEKNFITVLRKFEGTKIGQKTSICNMFINKTKSPWDTGGMWVYADHYALPNKYFNVPKTTLSTLEEWETWLSTHPLEVLYSLAVPVEYDLTNEQVEQFKKLKSYYGTTYIDNDAVPACNMTADIVVDTKMYIDSKFTTLAGQILEMGV